MFNSTKNVSYVPVCVLSFKQPMSPCAFNHYLIFVKALCIFWWYTVCLNYSMCSFHLVTFFLFLCICILLFFTYIIGSSGKLNHEISMRSSIFWMSTMLCRFRSLFKSRNDLAVRKAFQLIKTDIDRTNLLLVCFIR